MSFKWIWNFMAGIIQGYCCIYTPLKWSECCAKEKAKTTHEKKLKDRRRKITEKMKLSRWKLKSCWATLKQSMIANEKNKKVQCLKWFLKAHGQIVMANVTHSVRLSGRRIFGDIFLLSLRTFRHCWHLCLCCVLVFFFLSYIHHRSRAIHVIFRWWNYSCTSHFLAKIFRYVIFLATCSASNESNSW